MFRQGSRVSSRSLKWFKSSQSEAGSGLFLKGYKSEKDFNAETQTALAQVNHLTDLAIKSNNDNVVENIDNLSNRLCLTGFLFGKILVIDLNFSRFGRLCSSSSYQ